MGDYFEVVTFRHIQARRDATTETELEVTLCTKKSGKNLIGFV